MKNYGSPGIRGSGCPWKGQSRRDTSVRRELPLKGWPGCRCTHSEMIESELLRSEWWVLVKSQKTLSSGAIVQECVCPECMEGRDKVDPLHRHLGT